MENLFNDTEFWQAIGYVVGAGLALGVLALAAYLTARGVKWTKDAIYYLRMYTPQAISAVDEPTDPINVAIERMLDRVLDRDWGVYASQLLPAILRTLADQLDDGASEEAIPPREVNIGARNTAPTSAESAQQ